MTVPRWVRHRISARTAALTIGGLIVSAAMVTSAAAATGGADVGDLPIGGDVQLGSLDDPSSGFLPSLPDGDSVSSLDLDGDVSGNVDTPGAAVSTPDGPTHFGTLTDDASPGATVPGGGHVYLADTGAQDFNSSTGGWAAYQEHSPFCHVRGVTCVNWNFEHVQSGGPAGDGDGFLRVNGTSLGVAPCMPNNGVARWVSPMFTYTTPHAQSWQLNFDYRQTAVLFGEGHSTFNIQILDDAGRVVTTAHGPQGTFPLNQWTSQETSFDGSKLVYGKDYRISIMVDIVHAETALSWGNLDFDNISMTAMPGEGPAPYTICQPSDDTSGAMAGLLAGRETDFCPLTNQLGQQAAPLLDAAHEVLATDPVNDLLDKGSGAFAVLDLETGQFLGYLWGKEAIPSTDPRDLLVYVKDGTLGEAANFVVVFAADTAALAPALLSDPEANLTSIVDGQVDNGRDLLLDPGRLTRIPVDWQTENATFVLETILNPLLTTDERDTQLGGVVFSDDNANGALDSGEPGVPGVPVTLTDVNGTSYGTETTDAHGRYVFTDLQTRSDPSGYVITVDPASLPKGSSFTTQHAPGTVHGTTSHVDEDTGQTNRITIDRYQQDLEWNVGLVGVGDAPAPAPAEPGDTSGAGGEGALPPLPGVSGELPGVSGEGDGSLGGVTGSVDGALPGTGGGCDCGLLGLGIAI